MTHLEKILNKKYVGLHKAGSTALDIRKLYFTPDWLTIEYYIWHDVYITGFASSQHISHKQEEIERSLKNYFNTVRINWCHLY